MIRLNDINKTVIDENEIKCYNAFTESFDGEDVESINFILTLGGINVHYETKEVRDKDIELLDKLFDAKDIEYEVMCKEKPTEYVNGIKKECEPVKEEKYVRWDDICYESSDRVELPNGEEACCKYEPEADCICFFAISNEKTYAHIYGKDLFNALMLKRVK